MRNTHQPIPAEQGDSSADEYQNLHWRRVHPLTPLANTWKVFAALFAIFIWHNTDTIGQGIEEGWLSTQNVTAWLPYVLLGLLGIGVVVGAYSWIAWKRMAFAIGDQAVWFRRGIISRSERHSRLDRIQSVDIVHPLIGRLFGLGNLNITVAGGSDTTLTIGLLTSAHMLQVQQEILDRVYRISEDTGNSADFDHVDTRVGDTSGQLGIPSPSNAATNPPLSTPQAPLGQPVQRAQAQPILGNEANSDATGTSNNTTSPLNRNPLSSARRKRGLEIPVFEVATSRLLGSIALSGFLVTFIVFVLVLTGTIILFVKMPETSAITFVTSLIALCFGFVSTFWSRVSKEFGFKAKLSADGIHIQHGLTDTVAETIPPRRIHAVQIQQSWLWRRFGWYRVVMTVAGKRNTKEMLESTTLLPVGTLQEALLAVWLVEPNLGVVDPAGTITAAMGPEDAATVLATAQREGNLSTAPLHQSVDTPSGQYPLTMLTSPQTSKLFDPFTWQRNATMLTHTVLMHRGGWLNRFVSVIPLSHVQSWEWHQGPWDRKRHLARIRPNLVKGLVNIDSGHLEETVSQSFMKDLSLASQQARGSETREDWSKRIQAMQRP